MKRDLKRLSQHKSGKFYTHWRQHTLQALKQFSLLFSLKKCCNYSSRKLHFKVMFYVSHFVFNYCEVISGEGFGSSPHGQLNIVPKYNYVCRRLWTRAFSMFPVKHDYWLTHSWITAAKTNWKEHNVHSCCNSLGIFTFSTKFVYGVP